MKYLNSFKLFEDNKSKPSIDDYVKLSHILMSEIFDKYHIFSIKEKTSDQSSLEKFWAFYEVKDTGVNQLIDSNPNTFKNIDKIIVFGLVEEEYRDFVAEFNNELLEYIESVLGYRLNIKVSEWSEVYDVWIELTKDKNNITFEWEQE